MKKLVSRLGFAALAVTILGAIGVGASTATAVGPCGPRNCLDVWRPVICSNGVVYSNSCYAARACATGCVPWGGDAI
ncbi:MAG: hypothetical protein U0640_10185 [Phycisphaerales bacterium]